MQLSVQILKAGEQGEKEGTETLSHTVNTWGLAMWHVETKQKVKLHEKKDNFMNRTAMIMHVTLFAQKLSFSFPHQPC